MSADRDRKYSKETFLVHGLPHDASWDFSYHVVPPITASTAFRLDSVRRGTQGFQTFAAPPGTDPAEKPIYIYDRLTEPTVALLENQFREIELSESATAFSSGMAAISGLVLALCSSGCRIVAHRTIYGCTYSLFTRWLPRMGIEVDFVDLTKPGALESAVCDTTRMVYFETPANPTLDIIDIEAVSTTVASLNENRESDRQILTVVDNTFATPYCQRPLKYGADFAVHSLTKNVMGFGTDMGGMVAGPAKYHTDIRMARKDFGGVVSPRAAWNILVYGIASLPVRSDKQQANALAVASYLESRPEVKRVYYPGLESHPQHEIALKQMLNFDGEFAPGIMVYFELDGKGEQLVEKACRFIDHIAENAYTMTLAVSLGQMKTLIEAPALMTHCAYGDAAEGAGMSPGGVRLSLGVENAKDIIHDLEDAFAVL